MPTNHSVYYLKLPPSWIGTTSKDKHSDKCVSTLHASYRKPCPASALRIFWYHWAELHWDRPRRDSNQPLCAPSQWCTSHQTINSQRCRCTAHALVCQCDTLLTIWFYADWPCWSAARIHCCRVRRGKCFRWWVGWVCWSWVAGTACRGSGCPRSRKRGPPWFWCSWAGRSILTFLLL